MDRIEDTVGQAFAALLGQAGDGTIKRVHVAGAFGDDNGCTGDLLGQPQCALFKAEQIIRTGAAASQQFIGFERIDADRKAGITQRPDAVLQVRKIHSRQAADVDHVGAVAAITLGALDDPGNAELRRVDDLGEHAHIVAAQIRGKRLATKIGWQILQVLGPTLHADTELLGQCVNITLAQARHDDTVDAVDFRQSPFDQLDRHQRGHADADVAHLVAEFRLHGLQHLVQAFLRQFAGQKDDVFGHVMGKRLACLLTIGLRRALYRLRTDTALLVVCNQSNWSLIAINRPAGPVRVAARPAMNLAGRF